MVIAGVAFGLLKSLNDVLLLVARLSDPSSMLAAANDDNAGDVGQ